MRRGSPVVNNEVNVPDEMAKLVFPSISEALASLPKAEQEEYERCQQSVVDARRAAPGNEGRLWIS